MSNYKDIIYEVGANAVRITINRPEVMNAFRLQTVEELIDAFKRADEEKTPNAYTARLKLYESGLPYREGN